MRSDLTSTSHRLDGSVKACWLHIFTLLMQRVLLLKRCLVTSKHSCSDSECYTCKVSLYPFKKRFIFWEKNNKYSVFIMPRNVFWFYTQRQSFSVAVLHGLSAKRGRWWWWWSHVWNQLLHFSGTIELPGLGLINTISKAEFPPALQCKGSFILLQYIAFSSI